MSATRCTCLRGGDLSLQVADPFCKAKGHLWDEMQQLEQEIGDIQNGS